MNTPSEEQQHVIDSISLGRNVMVDACAGSGKSTTILSCALALPQYQFIQLTFNKQLQSEVQESVNKLKLQNIHVYTFHGLAVKYYNSDCHNDMGIRRVLRDKTPARTTIPKIDIMVLDETQDMTKVYFDLIWNFLMEMGTTIQLLILGDEKQGLYGFKGADTRFLTMASSCWRSFPFLKQNGFTVHRLQMSYRITDPMCEFLNKAMLGYERVKSCKPGVPVVYIRRSIYSKYDGFNSLYNMIVYLMKLENAKYDDFFVLCRSVKASNRMVRQLENLLVEKGIPCYIPNNDSKDDLDTRVIQNKVVFSTFHASKGRQRPYVIVLGFDDSHFSFFAKDKDPNVCPNELYVACTRATKKLFVWENAGSKTFTIPFLKYSHCDMMKCSFISFNGTPSGKRPIVEKNTEPEIRTHTIHPSDLIRFLSEETLDIISPMVDDVYICSSSSDSGEDIINVPNVKQTLAGFCEDVSDLTGTVLPLIYFDYLRQSYEPILQNIVLLNMKEVPPDIHGVLHDAVKNMPSVCETTQDYLYLANLATATQLLLYSRFKQISLDDYNWIDDEIIQKSNQRLDDKLREECASGTWQPEQYIIHGSDELAHISIDSALATYLNDSTMTYRFSARADVITEKSLWELKCTNQLTIDHKLQLIIYAWLYEMKYTPATGKKKLSYFLFNIKTNETLELKASLEQLTRIVSEIIKNKYYQREILSDEKFIQQFDVLPT